VETPPGQKAENLSSIEDLAKERISGEQRRHKSEGEELRPTGAFRMRGNKKEGRGSKGGGHSGERKSTLFSEWLVDGLGSKKETPLT